MDGRLLNPKGEISLMIEWSWRIEKGNSIVCGSWSDEEIWEPSFAALVGLSVVDVAAVGRLPEIMLMLTNECYVVSFMTCNDDPAWALINRRNDKLPALRSRQGMLCPER